MLSGPGRVSSLPLRWSSWVLYGFVSKTCQDILFISLNQLCLLQGRWLCLALLCPAPAHAHSPEPSAASPLTHSTRAEKLFSRALRRLEGDDIQASVSETVKPCVMLRHGHPLSSGIISQGSTSHENRGIKGKGMRHSRQ